MNRHLLTIAVVVFLFSPAAIGEQMSFQDALTLALKNAKVLTIAHADAEKARNGFLEARNLYIPQVGLGSGVGYSFGFPLGTPSIFNITTYSTLFNPAQREYIRSARFEINASQEQLQDKRQQTILDTALTYADLDRHLQALDLLGKELEAANSALTIVQQRIGAGIEPETEGTRAKLNVARIRLKRAQVEGEADLLRLRLAQLTGANATELTTVSGSMPKPPDVPQEDTSGTTAANHPAYKAALNDALAKDHAAQAERKQLYPQINAVGQYALFSNTLNNYSSFYKNFQRNNGAFGVEIKVPLFNRVQSSKYHEALADADKAHAQADDTKDTLTSEAFRLQRVAQQAFEAQQVAELEYELSQNDTAAARAKAGAGQASPKDIQNAQLAEEDKRAAMLDAGFNYLQARLQLMRLSGDLEGWAKAGGAPAP